MAEKKPKKYFKQKVGKGKGTVVKFIREEGNRVLVIGIKLRFPYRVLKVDFEKYYEPFIPKKKRRKKNEERRT